MSPSLHFYVLFWNLAKARLSAYMTYMRRGIPTYDRERHLVLSPLISFPGGNLSLHRFHAPTVDAMKTTASTDRNVAPMKAIVFFLFLSLFFVRSEKELGWRKQIGRWPRTAFVWAPDLWEPIFMEGFTLAEGLLRGIRARNKQEILPVVNRTRQVQIYTAPFNPNIGTGWRRSGLYQHEKFWARTMKVRKKRHFRVQVVV